ncbi:MAG: hypothetical protein IJS26_05410 [Alphaproteobacteria bacterium]|nr:hypothetical protein [Alphaproteobacteria bacterium]
MASTFLNLDTDTTLGGNSASNSVVSSQAAVKAYADTKQTSNLVTSLSSASTDAQYPSAKCVYDLLGDVESAINTIRGVS